MNHKNLPYIWILGIFLNLPLVLFSQDQLDYSGSLQVGKLIGDANYEYSVIDGDTILNGSFRFQSTDIEALLEKEDTSFSIKGNFKNDYPSGVWAFRFNSFQSDRKSKVEGYQYVVNVSGVQRTAQGNIEKGKPHGTWTCSAQEIKDSEIDKVTFKSVIDFENGIPQRSFRIEDEQQELVGRFLRNGVAHDDWTLYSDNEIGEAESWSFKEGVLQRIQIQSRGNIDVIKIYPELTGKTKIILLDKAYLNILKLKLKSDDISRITQSGILDLLDQNDRYYQSIDRILSTLSTTSSFSPEFKVKVPFFPLEASETSSLVSIENAYKKSRKITSSLLGDTQLTILKLSDDNVRALEESVSAVSEKILNPIEQIVQCYKDSVIQYITRGELIQKAWSTGVPTIQQVRKNQWVTQNKGKNTNSLISTEELANQTFRYLDSVQKILLKKINKQKRKQEAIDLEEKMIAQLQYLEELETSFQTDTIPKVYVKTLQNIRENAADKLSQYSAIENVDAKLTYARELVNCFDALDQIGDTIVKLPGQQNEIQQKYVDAVWNPFTATIMNETVKKRITEAYASVLIPYFLKEIEEGLSCEDTAQWIDLVNKTHQRMLEMRTEDTKKLERKLKKENDPQVLLQRFQIYDKNKEK
ncbi:hypothetical protein [Aquimarina pacifica]|uniref:hypothetical protein n=1 Tax=Aquimarina pacifica TaxID=1296415 RepID=UPI000472548A|nr:hypothetical protein [Aquimarina pacifica]